MLAYLNAGSYQPWGGQPVNGQAIPPNAETAWTLAQLNAAGLYPVTNFTVPNGQEISGPASYQLDANGTNVDEVYPTQPIPATPVPVANAPTLLPQAPDDAAAAALNPPVPVGSLYCNGSQVMQRQS